MLLYVQKKKKKTENIPSICCRTSHAVTIAVKEWPGGVHVAGNVRRLPRVSPFAASVSIRLPSDFPSHL
jgi:hypothetical protein